MEISWISHACFKIKTESGKVIYLDPYEIPKNEEKADIVVASHSHSDHLSNSSVTAVMKDTTMVLGPETIKNKLKKFNGKGLKIGESLELGDVLIHLTPAYTIQKSTHPKSNEWAGIIIETEGKRLYHAGDTERIPEMKHLHKTIDLAFLPCGGTYTMDFEEASDAAIDIKPEILVPMHNWGKNLEEFKELMKKKEPEIQVRIIKETPLKL